MAFNPKICRVCGAQFIPKTGNQICCSQECRNVVDAERKRKERKVRQKKKKPMSRFMEKLGSENMRRIAELAREASEAHVSYGLYLSRKAAQQ